MANVTIHEAKTHLSRLIKRARAGEEIIIMHGRTPVVRLAPMTERLPERTFGAMAGQIAFDDSFFDDLPEDELNAWE